MKKKVLIGIIALIVLVIAFGYWYWWYNTPHITKEENVKLNTPIGLMTKIVEISYKDDYCRVVEYRTYEEYNPTKISVKENITSMLTSNNISFNVLKEEISQDYDKMVVRLETANKTVKGVILWNSKKILISTCDKENGEYISQWFVDKYG